MDNAYSKFDFRQTTGYVLSHSQQLIAIRHSASVLPWSDPDIHKHSDSEEYYFLLKGQLDFLVQHFQISLHPNEILMVKPEVPHAILGGRGRIEHIGIRTPALDDRQIVRELKKDGPLLYESERLISGDWGHRIPLEVPKHQNCWLIGKGSALFESQHLIMAYLDFPTNEAANAGIGTRHQVHLHQKSWEYYGVLKGEKILLIENAQVPVHAGEILAVPPGVKHALHSRQAPFQGFTIRVPVELDDKVIIET